MTYRRSPRQTEAALKWAAFVAENAAGVLAAGIPLLATQTIEHWDDLLMHGTFDHHEDPAEFALARLSTDQYDAYVSLVDSYFAMGYEYYSPLGLHQRDLDLMASKYGPNR